MRFIKPSDYSPTNRSGSNRAYDKAREAAIERKLSQYIHLSCGHLTTWELDMLYSFCRPARNKIWCEKCTKWKTAKTRKVMEYPNEPMF